MRVLLHDAGLGQGGTATFSRYKGIGEVMAGLPELIAETPELVYPVAGDGDDRARLDAIIDGAAR